MANCYRWDGNTLWLQVKVHAGARAFSLGPVLGDALRVNLRAPAREGRATEELLKRLAEEFAVRPAAVQLVRGAFQSRKLVRIMAPGRLPSALQPPPPVGCQRR